MKKLVLLFLMFLGCHFCYGQRYTLTSYMYSISKPNNLNTSDVRQYSTIVVDLNKLTIEVHRKDKSFYFKILEMKNKTNGGRNFKCADITVGRYLECWVNYDDMSALYGRKIFQMWFSYGNMDAYYFISSE